MAVTGPFHLFKASSSDSLPSPENQEPLNTFFLTGGTWEGEVVLGCPGQEVRIGGLVHSNIPHL